MEEDFVEVARTKVEVQLGLQKNDVSEQVQDLRHYFIPNSYYLTKKVSFDIS